jgi:allophanate hydrolase subunit 2
MGSLATVRASGLATVQDGGRWGWTDIGVPVAGALHRARYLVATGLLVGNADDTCPTIELLAGRLVLDVEVATAMCVVGPANVDITGQDVPTGTVVATSPGAVVTVRHGAAGPVYVAIAGWRPRTVLGSCATDTFSGLGPRPLAAGDELAGSPGGLERVGSFHRPLAALDGSPAPLRVVGSAEPALASPWTVVASSRSGVRLDGGSARGIGTASSAPLVAGALQLTPAGELIVIGRDGGVTGGYPVVGVIASCDLDRVSLLEPGDSVRFAPMGVDSAAERYERQERELRTCVVPPSALSAH